MQNLVLYTSSVCPFAQRTTIVLNSKNLDYQIIEINLDDKPSDFLKLSPYGKGQVPLLKHGNKVIGDSSIINEYLEEAFPQIPLYSGDLHERAMQRTWITYCNNEFIPIFYKVLLNQSPEKFEKLKDQLIQSILFIENECFTKTPRKPQYFCGNTVSIVDITFYPFFERFIINEYYRQVKIPDSCIYLKSWIENMRSLPEVKSTVKPPEFYIARYAKYADGTTSRSGAKKLMDEL